MLPLTKVEVFFNNSQPCPPEIIDCEKLRIDYAQEVAGAQNPNGGCSPCKMRGIRNKYINIITSQKNG